MKNLIAMLFALLPMLAYAQCALPALPIAYVPDPPSFIDGFHNLSTIDCYNESCTCKAMFSVNIPPFDGCLEMVGTLNDASVIVTTQCKYIHLDTCVQMGIPGQVAKVCFQSSDTVQFHVCSLDSAYIKITAIPTFVEPTLPVAFIDTDTLCPQAASFFSYFTGDTIPCYTAICPHPKTYQDALFPPWDGCIGFDQAVPGWGSLVLVVGDKIVLDTCILTPGTGIPTQVCWSSNDTVKVFYYGPDSTQLGVWYFPGSGYPPLLNEIADVDTLCPIPLSIDRPIEQQDQTPIDIITGLRVSSMEPNRVYLVGRKLKVRIE